MSLTLNAIDRLFARLIPTYGAQWTRMWEGIPISDVKTAWAYELAPFAGRLDSIAWALENLPPRCPNVIEFKALCRQAPRPPEQQLPLPKADPERVATELSKLRDVATRSALETHAVDPKGWAKTLKARDEAGEKLNPTVRRFYREALRVHLIPEEA